MTKVEEFADLLLLQQRLLLELTDLIQLLEHRPWRELNLDRYGRSIRSALEHYQASNQLLLLYSDLLPRLQDSIIAMNRDVEDLRKMLVDLNPDEENKLSRHRWSN